MSSFVPCEFLEWDSDFFGRRIGRVLGANGLYGAWRGWAQDHDVDCLYLLLPTQNVNEIGDAQRARFNVVDERVTLTRRVDCDVPEADAVNVRLATEHDIARLSDIASTAHRATRFYSDGHFDEERCGRLYRTWIEKHFKTDPIIVAEHDGAVAGYIAYSVAADTGRLGLVGVAEEGRGKGLGKAMTHEALRRIRDAKCTTCTVVTQGGNEAAMSLYGRAGFEVYQRETWLHWWRQEDL